MNETISQLVDAVRSVQEDQTKLSSIIDKLATKVINIHLLVVNYFCGQYFFIQISNGVHFFFP